MGLSGCRCCVTGLHVGWVEFGMLNANSDAFVSRGLSRRGGGARPAHREILGVKVAVLTKNAALARIARLIVTETQTNLTFLNAHGANIAWKDDAFFDCLEKFEVLPDGVGVDLGSLINYGEKFPDNLNGTDFIPAMLEYLDGGVLVGLLGAEPGVAELAAERMRDKFPDHRFEVAGHGFFAKSEEAEIIDRLKEKKPDILLVALGNPKQEKWIVENCTADHCILAFGVGAYFDFVAGKVPRAPRIFRHLRLEWLFRLGLEPRRMWKRYVVGNPAFLIRSYMQKYGLGRSKRIKK